MTRQPENASIPHAVDDDSCEHRKIEHLERLIAQLANVFYELEGDAPSACSALGEWFDGAVDYDEQNGWIINYPD